MRSPIYLRAGPLLRFDGNSRHLRSESFGRCIDANDFRRNREARFNLLKKALRNQPYPVRPRRVSGKRHISFPTIGSSWTVKLV
jgi:hypothetical protein